MVLFAALSPFAEQVHAREQAVDVPACRRQVLSFTNAWLFRSRVDAGVPDVVPSQLAVFDSGAVLLLGERAGTRRAAMVAPGTSTAVSVTLPDAREEDRSPHVGRTEGAELLLATPATDGRVLLASGGGRLVEIKSSAGRMAAVYDVPGIGRSTRHVQVYDTEAGAMVSSYGRSGTS
jgi:hypothetical protein